MALDLEKEVRELKRRLDLAETRLAQLEGRFEFISGQLGDIQLYIHGKFTAIGERFDTLDQRFDTVDLRLDKVDAKLTDHDQRFEALDARPDKLDADIDGVTRSVFDLTGQIEALPRAISEMLSQQDKRAPHDV
jgi:chaperonin cofactor prefoldin